MSEFLSRDEFLEEGKLNTEEVTLKSGKKITVSEISGSDYIKMWSDPKNQKETGKKLLKDGVETDEMVVDMSRLTPVLLTYSVVNPDGSRMFNDEDVELLARLASGPFLKVAEVARKLNGMSGEEAKNSETIQPDLNCGESQSDSVTDIQTS